MFPVHARNEASPSSFLQGLVKRMHASSKRSDGKSHKPVLLALWDAVGITRELNGHRNEVAGRLEQYGHERNLQVTTLHQLDGIKKSLADAAEADRQGSKERAGDATRSHNVGAKGYAQLRLQAKAKPEPQQSQMLQDIALMERCEQHQVPHYLTKNLNQNIQGYDYAWKDPAQVGEMKKLVEANRAAIKAQADNWINGHEKRYDDDVHKLRAKSWDKYEKKLNLTAIKEFRDKYAAFTNAAAELMNARTIQLIRWLEAPLLIDTLSDYDPSDIGDGLAFDGLIGDALFGIGLSHAGKKKLAKWAAEQENFATSNLVWRSIALNQTEGIGELQQMLAIAHKNKATILTEKTAKGVLDNLRTFAKLADVYKKAQSFADTAVKAGTAFTWAFGKADKLVLTVGEALYASFSMNKSLDTIGEKVVQHVLCIRAFTKPADSVKLIETQANFQQIANAQMTQTLANARKLVNLNSPEMATAERNALKNAWSRLPYETKAIALRDVRLAMVVAIFEGANFVKCAYQMTFDPKKRDTRTAGYMMASALSVTSLMFDVAATGVKNSYAQVAGEALKGLGDEAKDAAKSFGEKSWSFQNMKMLGGLFSAAASTVGMVMDYNDSKEAKLKGDDTLETLYRAKAAMGLGSVLSGIATTTSYTPQLSARLVGKVAGEQAAKWLTERIIAMSLLRVIAMGFGWVFTIAGIGLTFYIMYYKDNELQVWCMRSEFGVHKPESKYNSFEEQGLALEKVMGVPEEESKFKT